jgi:hypothetical protein
LKCVKDKLTIDFQEVVNIAESINSCKINASLQAQRDHLNEEFEERIQILWDTHGNELEVERYKLNSSLENTRASKCTLESIKAQALAINEDLAKENNELLSILINIWVEWKEQLNL